MRRIFDFVGEENGTGTSAEDGSALVGKFADGVVEALLLEELELGGAFAAGEDQAVAADEVGDGADFDGFCTSWRSMAAWAAKSPWMARMPIFMMLDDLFLFRPLAFKAALQ